MATSDRARFEDLYGQYRKNVHAYCARRVSGANVPDVVAETFLVAWSKIDQVPPGRAGLFWLYGVAYRLIKHGWRTYARRGRAIERLASLVNIEPVSPPDEVVVQRDEYRLVREAASRLREIDQEILRLTLWEELSNAEAAEVLDIEVGAVKQRSFRARHRLGVEYRRLQRDHANPPLLGKEVPE